MKFSLKRQSNLYPDFFSSDYEYFIHIEKTELKKSLQNDKQEYCSTLTWILDMFCGLKQVSYDLDDEQLIDLASMMDIDEEVKDLVFAIQPDNGRLKLIVSVGY